MFLKRYSNEYFSISNVDRLLLKCTLDNSTVLYSFCINESIITIKIRQSHED